MHGIVYYISTPKLINESTKLERTSPHQHHFPSPDEHLMCSSKGAHSPPHFCPRLNILVLVETHNNYNGFACKRILNATRIWPFNGAGAGAHHVIVPPHGFVVTFALALQGAIFSLLFVCPFIFYFAFSCWCSTWMPIVRVSIYSSSCTRVGIHGVYVTSSIA